MCPEEKPTDASAFESMGLIRVRGCCLFTWREREYGKGPRIVEVGSQHCKPCIAALKVLIPRISIIDRDEKRAEPRKARRVMVIDDDDAIRSEFAAALADAGCKVTTFSSARQALAYLRSGAPLPGIILLDLMMPDMNGYQFRQEQNSDPALAHIPIVVVTAANEPRHMEGARVLRKPIDLDVLLEVLELEPDL